MKKKSPLKRGKETGATRRRHAPAGKQEVSRTPNHGTQLGNKKPRRHRGLPPGGKPKRGHQGRESQELRAHKEKPKRTKPINYPTKGPRLQTWIT